MGRPNPRHGKGRGRIRTQNKFVKQTKQKTKRDTELNVTPWFPEDEEDN